jgi:hypothetical protein
MKPASHSRSILLLLLLLPCFIWAMPPNTPLRVVIIRHGEKPEKGHELSCQGQNRAAALPAVLYQKFGKPGYTYVPDMHSPGKTTGSRMYQTAAPFVNQYKLSLNSTFDKADYPGIAADILRKNGTVLVVWEHSAIKGLAKALGVTAPGKWPDDDFDSIWIITFDHGKAVLQKDREGLHPSTACK